MIVSAQSKMARAALGWTTADLAKRASVGVATVNRFETGQAVPIAVTLQAIKRALEDGGVIFEGEGEATDGGPGVRLKRSPT